MMLVQLIPVLQAPYWWCHGWICPDYLI